MTSKVGDIMNPPNRPPIELTWDALQAPDVTARVEQLRAAGAPPLIRSVGAPTSSSRNILHNGIVTLGLAGVVGGLLGWALSELMTNIRAEERTGSELSHWYGSSPTASAVVFALFIALGIGGVFAAWEGIEARSAKKVWRRLSVALPVLAIGGAIGGYLAEKLYESRIQAAYVSASAYLRETGDNGGALGQMEGARHIARGIGFAIFGLAIGLALGAASRSTKRAINGAIGGFLGGAVGGYTFDYVHIGDSGVASRLVAITICGTVIGLAVGLVEQVRKDNWLEIVSGGMAGKQFIL